MSLFGPRGGRSYPLRVVIVSETLPEDPDHDPGWYRIESVEQAGPHRAWWTFESEEEWFREMWSNVGLDMIGREAVGLSKGGDLLRLVVVGTMWWSNHSTFDGEDFDGGFDVESVEDLLVESS